MSPVAIPSTVQKFAQCQSHVCPDDELQSLDVRTRRLPRMKTAAAMALLGAVTLGTLNAAAPAPVACESLAQMKVTNGRVLSAESVKAGAFTPPNTPNANAAAAFTTVPGILSRDAAADSLQ